MQTSRLFYYMVLFLFVKQDTIGDMSSQIKALIILGLTIVIGPLTSIVARTIVRDIPPFTVFFFRMLIASSLFLPPILKNKTWQKKYMRQLVHTSFLASLNFAFFIWGIQYTTANASQLIYGLTPLIILLLSHLVFGEAFPKRKYIGVVIGLAGILYILYRSSVERGASINGSIQGNSAVLIAMIVYALYLIQSKKLTHYFSALEISGMSILVSLVIAFPLFIMEMVNQQTIRLSSQGVLELIFLGTFSTFFMYLFYQYAVRHLSTLTVGLSTYLTPITTAILAGLLIHERLTSHFLFGTSLVLLGIFTSTTLEVHNRRKAPGR